MCCFKMVPLKGVKKFQTTPTKHAFGTSLVFLFKISDEHPRPFDMVVPPGIFSSPKIALVTIRAFHKRYDDIPHCAVIITFFSKL